ncbi:MAG: ABC transporter permease [Acidobacteriales bacterium]|nr:ABC transporter permease [Terriglobales bacterium]
MSVDLLSARWDLLIAWTSRTIRARYQQTVLGVLWAIIQPLATVAIFNLVFTRFVHVNTDGVPYILFSFVAVVPWTFFASSLTDGLNSITDNMNLVAKVYFPRELLAVAVILARLVDFAIAAGALAVLMVYHRIPLFGKTWLYFPLIVMVQFVLSLGLGLIGSALNVFYRDIKHMAALGLQILIYASPVIYPASAVPQQLRQVYFLNPMAGVLESYRAVLLHGGAPDPHLLWSGLSAFAVLLFGYFFFKRLEPEFADVG